MSTRTLRILVIEDHDESRQALQRLLEQEGHTVVSANGVHAARSVAAMSRCELAIGEIDLPDGDGCDIMRMLREATGLRCIAVSAHVGEEHDRRIAHAGIGVRLHKPVQFQQLLDAIDKCMR